MPDPVPDLMTPTPLHLAIDIGPMYGHRTGVGVAVEGMVRTLGERQDVELDPYLVSYRSSLESGHTRLPLPGIVASHLWSRSNRIAGDRWLGSADVVHGTNYVAPPTRKPTVVSVYDCWFLANPGSASALVRRAGATLRRRVRDGAWVHASSDATAALVGELLGTDRVRTIYLGSPTLLDEAAERRPDVPGMTDGRPFIVCVATEERRKGLPLLIAAFEHLADDHPDLRLVLVGAPGDDTPAVTQAIIAAGSHTRGRIHRIGTVDDAAKQWLVRHAALLAYPSIDEGFGFPVLEAHALGTPVVATGVGSITEIAGDAAELVTDRDPVGFAEALQRVVTGGTSRLGLIEAGYRNVARFRWETTAERLTELYRHAVEAAR
ncbi:MAG: glycosyltransferase family 1 protein [Ilumatobacteraceae bacterium]